MPKPLHIIGAGFSGLVAAHYLVKAGHHTAEIFEKAAAPGGLIQTSELPYGIAESAANALLNSLALEELAKEIGVELLPASPKSRARYIYRDGKPRRWPLHTRETLRLLQAVPALLFQRKKFLPLPEESVEAWSRRELGEGASHHLLGPALQGIYASGPEQLSAQLVLGHFFTGEKKPKSPKFRGSVSPRKGMGEFIQALAAHLQSRGVRIHYNTEYTLQSAIPVLLCTGAPAAAKILQAAHPALAQALAKINLLPVVSVTLFYPRSTPSIRGFGCLFPKDSGFRARGVLANHEIFPDHAKDCHSETWILGGDIDRNITQASDAEILAIISSDRKRLHANSASALASKIHRWPQAIPHYTVELERRLSTLPKPPGIHLFGNYLGQLGLTKILESAQKLPEQIHHA